jgi:hypothetical protein
LTLLLDGPAPAAGILLREETVSSGESAPATRRPMRRGRRRQILDHVDRNQWTTRTDAVSRVPDLATPVEPDARQAAVIPDEPVTTVAGRTGAC